MKEIWGADRAAPLEGSKAATVPTTASLFGKTFGEKLTVSEIQQLAPLVRADEERGSGRLHVTSPAAPHVPIKTAVDPRWILLWERTEGEPTVKARQVVMGRRNPDSQRFCWRLQSA